MRNCLTTLVISLAALLQANAGLEFGGASASQADATTIAQSNNVTFACWIKHNTPATGACIIYDGIGNANGYGLYLSDNSCGAGTKVSVLLGLAACRAAGGDTSLTANVWYHVAFTHDTTTWRVYINGVQEATTGTTAIHAAPGTGLSLGGNNGGDAFKGRIEDVQFYTRVLAASEILELYKSHLRYHLLGANASSYWPLDNGKDGTSAASATANDRKGSLTFTVRAGSDAVWRASQNLSYP
jgi:Concanavalin A-like lectin/glucanases superfamily